MADTKISALTAAAAAAAANELAINEAGTSKKLTVAQLATFLAPDVQVFTATGAGTWTKPTAFTPKTVMVVCIGAGGGGGGGGSNTGAAIRMGGAGGGGGAHHVSTYVASDLGATESLSVGAGGAGGVGGASGSVGNDGAIGGNSTFGTTVMLTGFGGGGCRLWTI